MGAHLAILFTNLNRVHLVEVGATSTHHFLITRRRSVVGVFLLGWHLWLTVQIGGRCLRVHALRHWWWRLRLVLVVSKSA